MKKVTLYFVCLLFIKPTFAQFNEFKGGFLFNPNVTLFSGGAVQVLEIRNYFAPSAGIYIKRALYKNLYATFDIRYIQKGNGLRLNEKRKIGIRLNYIETPLMLGYSFDIKKKKLYLEFGLALGHLIGSKTNHYDFIYLEREIDDFRKNELSLVQSVKTSLNKEETILIGFRTSLSGFFYSIHNYYDLNNFVFGLEFIYLIR